ncbi:unnamed protein product [Scytosiphon promiscuus]
MEKRWSNQDWRSSHDGGNSGRGRGGWRGRRAEVGGRGGVNLFMFTNRDMEPRHQHDMRSFVMAARLHAETGKLSEAISWLGDSSQHGVSRVMNICRASSSDLDVDAGPNPGRVSFQRVFLPLIDLATSTEFKNSPLRRETNVLFSTLYKLDQAEGLWRKVFSEMSKLAERGSVADERYSEFHRDRDENGYGLWEPVTWVDVALPIARFMVEVTKRFRDDVLLDKPFQEAATETLPRLIAMWKERGSRFDPSPGRAKLRDVDDAMTNLQRLMGAALQILRDSESARTERKGQEDNRNTRSALFNLADTQDVGYGAMYDGPGVFSRLQVRRHDNDAENISEISVAPTAGEILCERSPYVPRNAPSTWNDMKHVKPLAPGSPAAVLDTHFRLLRQDFVEPLREAVLGYRKEQLTAQQENREGRVGGGRGGVFKAATEGGRSFMSLFVFRNVQVVEVTGTSYGGVCVALEFDKPDAVMNMTQIKQKEYWERSGRLAVANMVVICEAQVTAVGDSGNNGSPRIPLLVFPVISERDVRELSGPSPRGRIGVSFDSSANTFAALEKMDALAGGSPDAGRLLMLQPSNSYFAYRPILQVLKSPERQILPFADILLPPTTGSPSDATTRAASAASDARPPRYLLQGDTYDLSDLATASSLYDGGFDTGRAALESVSMLDQESFPTAELLEHTTLDEAQLQALHAALSREVALIQGPPGTGKTFVGAKAVRLLLTNRQRLGHWNGPIMCVCLTNHALDQFLCDLLDAGVEGIYGKKLMAIRNDFRDANGVTTVIADTLLQYHAPELHEAILNSNKTPLKDEEGFQTVGKMPSGTKDWLAANHPRGGATQASRPSVQKADKDLKARKRRDQQRALDRRTAPAPPPGESASLPMPPSGVEDACGADDKAVQEERDQDGLGAVEAVPEAAAGQDEGHRWEEAGLAAPETAWLDPKDRGEGVVAAAFVAGQTWSLADSGMAAMADGEEWDLTYDEALGEVEGHHEVVVAHGEGGHLEEKGTRPPPFEPPAPLPHGSAEPLRVRAPPPRPGFPSGEAAAGPDDVGGRGFAVGRGKRVDRETTEAGTHPAVHRHTTDQNSEVEEWVPAAEGEEDADGKEGDFGNEEESSDGQEQDDASVTSSEGGDGSSSSSSDDSGDSPRDGTTGQEGGVDSAPGSPFVRREGPKDYATIMSEITQGRSVWALSREERWTLCRHWQQAAAAKSRERLASMIDEFFDLWERHNSHKTQGERAVLREAEVVGMTTTGVAMHQDLVESLGAAIVVVEEAAEVMEAHILAVLTQSTQHLILIAGDHLQLRPKAEVYRLTKESRRGFDLDVSMFERLVEERRVPVHDLATQRRMRPEIADLIRPAVYPNLKDAPHVLRYPSVKGMRQNLFFWDHAVPEDSSGTVASSKTNRHEAKLVAGLVLYLLKQGYTEQGDITVLTPYLGQLFVLKDIVGSSSVLHVQVNERDSAKLDEMGEASDNHDDDDDEGSADSEDEYEDGSSPMVEVANRRVGSMIRMATIDNFQGEESKIIILSLVRSNRNGDIGFLRSSNRVNVALSRAQHGMYIIGNAGKSLELQCTSRFTSLDSSAIFLAAGMIESRSGTMWSESVIPSLREKDALGPTLELQCARHADSITRIRKHEEFASLAGDGGCSRACSSRLPCGHTCVRRCHPDDPHHFGVRCSEPCPRLLQPCEHPCQRLCGDDCGPCVQRIKVVDLPCGHQAKNVSCNTVWHLDKVRCVERVTLEIPGCGHEIMGRCTATRAIVENPALCTARCGQPLPCGHLCAANCGRCTTLTLSGTASAHPGPSTPSEHQQRESSMDVAGGAWAAATAGDDVGEDEGDSAAAAASEAAAAAVVKSAETRTHHATCTIECGRHRPCGHRCELPCHEGRPCPPCTKQCALSCEHSACSQRCVDPCILCAESCTWYCPHKAGSCRLPCGAPCVRLPCDIRCERKLRCGHRCPSVCGEDCPGPEYCRECSAPHTSTMTHVVDMLEFKTLREHDPSVEPIVVLSCGHAYTLSTLDGLLDLASAYKKDEQSGEWVAPLPLESDCSKLKLCPDCRAPVSGVSRYNRITNKAKMDMAEVKHSEWCRKEIALAEEDLAVAGKDGVQPSVRNNRIKQAAGTLQRVLKMSRETPCTRVYEAAVAALKRARATAHELATVSRLQPDRSVRVKALAGLGKVRTLHVETLRLQLRKAVTSLKSITRDAQWLSGRSDDAVNALRTQAFNRARGLEARATQAYQQGVGTLLGALRDAERARSTAAGAETKMALVDLYVQGTQCLLVSKELSILRPESRGTDTGAMTHIGRRMVQQGLALCTEVACSPLASVRQRYEDRAEARVGNLHKLEGALKGITLEEVEMVKAVAANTALSGGVTRYHKCPNGHWYGVGNCGELNEGGFCPECGYAIGGTGSH